MPPLAPTAPEATPVATPDLSARLRQLGACQDARQWAAGLDWPTAWATCERGDWMMWLLRRLDLLDNHSAARLACRFAREVLHLNTDKRVSGCIETVEDWLNGKATIGQVRVARKAADAAYAAAYAAYGDAAADAADAAAAAADAAYAAAAAAAADAARLKARARQAEIIRELVPMPTL